jgi:mevalonate kinase
MSNYITQIAITVLFAIAAFLGMQAKNLYQKYVNNEVKQAIVKNAVLFVEQTCKDIHGREKLLEAMKKASDMLDEYGITVSSEELVTMIESAVREFINSFNK